MLEGAREAQFATPYRVAAAEAALWRGDPAEARSGHTRGSASRTRGWQWYHRPAAAGSACARRRSGRSLGRRREPSGERAAIVVGDRPVGGLSAGPRRGGEPQTDGVRRAETAAEVATTEAGRRRLTAGAGGRLGHAADLWRPARTATSSSSAGGARPSRCSLVGGDRQRHGCARGGARHRLTLGAAASRGRLRASRLAVADRRSAGGRGRPRGDALPPTTRSGSPRASATSSRSSSRAVQTADRRGAVHQREHGRRPRLEHPGQARRVARAEAAGIAVRLTRRRGSWAGAARAGGRATRPCDGSGAAGVASASSGPPRGTRSGPPSCRRSRPVEPADELEQVAPRVPRGRRHRAPRTPSAWARRSGASSRGTPRATDSGRRTCGARADPVTAPPNSSRSRSSVPHRIGDSSPAGGGTCRPLVLKSWPMKPSGVWATSPIRPPAGRRGRARGRSAPGPARTSRRTPRSRRRSSRPRTAAPRRRRTRSPRQPLGVRRAPGPIQQRRHIVHAHDGAPRRAAASAALPLPVATSRTRSVAWTSSASMSSSETSRIWVPTMWYAAARQVAGSALLDGGEVGVGSR